MVYKESDKQRLEEQSMGLAKKMLRKQAFDVYVGGQFDQGRRRGEPRPANSTDKKDAQKSNVRIRKELTFGTSDSELKIELK